MRLEDVGEGGRLPGYLLGKVVGEGGFCKVRAAIHRVTGAKTAVKLIEKAKLRDPEDRARLGREIKVLKRLSHRHVIRLFDVVEDARWVFCVMEYADGGSLLDHVRARRRVPEPEAARFAYQLCQALACCHASGVAHRDVKLENVLLDARRDVKLIDFGLAAFTSPGRKLETHCGSPSYAAPEIVQRKPYDGPPVDVWSTGVVLFACVAGHLPFHAPKNDKKELCRKIASGAYVLPSDASKDFADVVSVILRVDPTRRASLATVLESRWIANRERRGEDERARAYASDDERRRKKTPGRAASARETAASGGFSGTTALALARDPDPGAALYPAAPSGASLDHERVAALEAAGMDRDALVAHLRGAEHNYLTAAYHLLAYRENAAAATGTAPEKEQARAERAALSSASASGGGAGGGLGFRGGFEGGDAESSLEARHRREKNAAEERRRIASAGAGGAGEGGGPWGGGRRRERRPSEGSTSEEDGVRGRFNVRDCERVISASS